MLTHTYAGTLTSDGWEFCLTLAWEEVAGGRPRLRIWSRGRTCLCRAEAAEAPVSRCFVYLVTKGRKRTS